MSRGAILFAFNSPKVNYYSMAAFTARRINHFLGLPVTIVTDTTSVPASSDYTFDNTIIISPDSSNKKDNTVWINKGRYKAYELSPYDETLLIDTDFLINSSTLSMLFDLPTDFNCHDTTSFLMYPTAEQERLSAYSFNTLWATVIMFKKTSRVKQLFETMQMIQHNYEHYANIHSFMTYPYRNDYALTMALRIINGHIIPKEDIIPWNLMHVGKNTSVHRNTDDEFNTEYTVEFDQWNKGKIRKEYMLIKDFDFHILNKELAVELMQ